MNRADLDKQIANAAARAAVAARNGDDDAWHEWSEWATRLLDQRDADQYARECADKYGAAMGLLPSNEDRLGTHRRAVSFYARPAT